MTLSKSTLISADGVMLNFSSELSSLYSTQMHFGSAYFLCALKPKFSDFAMSLCSIYGKVKPATRKSYKQSLCCRCVAWCCFDGIFSFLHRAHTIFGHAACFLDHSLRAVLHHLSEDDMNRKRREFIRHDKTAAALLEVSKVILSSSHGEMTRLFLVIHGVPSYSHECSTLGL